MVTLISLYTCLSHEYWIFYTWVEAMNCLLILRQLLWANRLRAEFCNFLGEASWSFITCQTLSPPLTNCIIHKTPIWPTWTQSIIPYYLPLLSIYTAICHVSFLFRFTIQLLIIFIYIIRATYSLPLHLMCPTMCALMTLKVEYFMKNPGVSVTPLTKLIKITKYVMLPPFC